MNSGSDLHTPKDPLVALGSGDPNTGGQWYFDRKATADMTIEAEAAWEDYTGTGITVAVMDSIINVDHRDLSENYDSSLDVDLASGSTNLDWETSSSQHYHGSAVAGVIAAEKDNGHGSVGVAHGATITNFAMDFANDDVQGMVDRGIAHSATVDVMNASWSYTQAFSNRLNEGNEAHTALMEGISEGRDGLGTVIVFAGGNSAGVTSSNYFALQNSPYTIAVGAVDSDGDAAAFSSLGSNLLLSAGGVDIISSQAYSGGIKHYSGTSFAAPMVSAAAALILEANPDLGYRDVQEIFALSARSDMLGMDARGGLGWATNGADNFNGGGMHYSDSYGYGYLNVRAAVRLAETWLETKTLDTLETARIKNNQSNVVMTAGETDSLIIDFDVEAGIVMEAAQLSIVFPWTHSNDLEIFLTSPDGTVSQLTYDMLKTGGGGNLSGFNLTTKAIIGENAKGTWELEIVNTDPDAKLRDGSGPMTATLKSVELTVYGEATDNDDTYYYNDEFADGLYANSSINERKRLSDSDGGVDTINAAMVSYAVTLDLSGAMQSNIGNQTLYIQAGVIENAFGGDGDDILIGSASDNDLRGGRGNDVLYASAGTDKLDGGKGNDKVVIDMAAADIQNVRQNADDSISFVWNNNKTTLSNIESIQLDDGTYDWADLFGSSLANPVPADPPEPVDEPEAEPPLITAGIVGTNKDDTLIGTAGTDTVVGKDGDDLIIGNGGDDFVFAGLGSDRVIGSNGNDQLHGGEGDDFLNGKSGDDVLYGDTGNDVLIVSNGINALYGGDGDDRLVGGRGTDTLDGGDGDDTLVSKGSDTTLKGGTGSDRYVLSAGKENVVLTFEMGKLNRVLNFSSDIDELSVELGEYEDGELVWQETGTGAFLGLDYHGEVTNFAFFSGSALVTSDTEFGLG